MKCRPSHLLAALVVCLTASTASAQILFSETFDTPASAANFNVVEVAAAAGATPNVYSEFGFDYSATGSSRLTTAIPAAPNGGSASGLVLAANRGAGSVLSALNVYPDMALINGNYRMTFDFWGGINNVSGTSEFLQVGAQSQGVGQHINGFPDASPDSDFFEINIAGDLGSSDYIAFTTRGGTPLLDQDFIPNTDPAPVAAFPNPPYTAQPEGGAPGEVWAEAEISHIDGITTLSFNGEVITTIEFSDFANDLGTAGIPWFGYTDFFGSVAGGDSPLVGGQAGVPVEVTDGDYNDDGFVDAADYTIFRDTLGDSVATGTGADGNENDVIDPADYDVWVAGFGDADTPGLAPGNFDPFNASFVIIDNVVVEAVPASTSVPEPSALLLASRAAAGFVGRRR